MSVQITPELVTAIASLVTAVGLAIKNARDTRRERRARWRELERVARAAARGPKKVAEVVEDLESTGEFTRPTGLRIGPDPRDPARARAREAGPPDT